MPASRIITRDFIFAFLAQFAFSSALFILVPTLPIYLARMKSPETEIGVSSVSSLLSRPLIGRALLKIPERDFMLVGYAIDLAGPSRGPAMGTFTALCDLGVGLGAVMMGIILRWTNYQVMFLSLALVGVIDLLYFNFLVKKRRAGNLLRHFKQEV